MENKERLIIKNFGPIQDVKLELGKMTVLIGDQATGKSTIAKVLAICRYFSYIVEYAVLESNINNQNGESNSFVRGLLYWEIESYANQHSYIEYENNDYKIIVDGFISINDFDDLLFCNNQTLISKSTRFKTLLSDLQELRKRELDEKDESQWYTPNWEPNENFFRLNVKKVMDNPFYIPAERGLQSLFLSSKNNNGVSESLLHSLSQINRIVRGFNIELNIQSANLVYKNENGIGYIKKSNEDNFYPLHNGASGYKSIIPIEIPIQFFSRHDKRKRTFIVEEPEINLFPTRQKKLMEFFVENVNENGHSFLIPTHSPYLLSALNELILAFKKGQNHADEVKEIVPKASWLNPDHLKVYELKEGKARSLINTDTGLIGENAIDDFSDEMNDEIDNLLDL